MKIAIGVILSAVGFYVIVLGGLYSFQRSLVFGPDRTHVQPADVGLSMVDEVALTTEDGKLYSWYLEATSGQPTLVYLHGNGGSVATRADHFRMFGALGYGVFMLGYPGYGGSDGSPSERGFVDAAHRAYDFLRSRGLQSQELVLLGESLGSSVAIQVAASREVRALILMAPMTSARDLAQERYPFVPMRQLLKDPFLSTQFIGRVTEPLLVIHGDRDQVISLSSGEELFALANEPKAFHVVEGGSHNDLFEFATLDVIVDFLRQEKMTHSSQDGPS